MATFRANQWGKWSRCHETQAVSEPQLSPPSLSGASRVCVVSYLMTTSSRLNPTLNFHPWKKLLEPQCQFLMKLLCEFVESRRCVLSNASSRLSTNWVNPQHLSTKFSFPSPPRSKISLGWNPWGKPPQTKHHSLGGGERKHFWKWPWQEQS